MKKTLLLSIVLLTLTFIGQVKAGSTISSFFNGPKIDAGKKIWFSSVVKVNGSATYPLTVYFTAQSISLNGSTFTVPNAQLTLDPSVTTATTTYNGSTWVTTAPPSMSGYYFISGFCDSLTTAVPPGHNAVSWTGNFTASQNVSVTWQWAAAVYTSFNANYANLGVKPSDCSSCSAYVNTDHAGSPEKYKTYVISGAGSHGGTDYTGDYNGTATVTAPVASFISLTPSPNYLTLCTGSTSTISSGSSATWTSSNPAVATVSGSGVVTGIAAGSATISCSAGGSLFLIGGILSTITTTTTSVTVMGVPTGATATTSQAAPCSGATVTLTGTANGATSYSWAGPADATISSPYTASTQATVVSPASTGVYTFSASNGCGSAIATVSLNVTSAGTITGTPHDATCRGYNNGTIDITVTGYTWIYDVMWSNGETSAWGAWGLAAGTYTAVATFPNGCTATASFTVNQPAAISATNVITPSSANDNAGAIDITLSGGTAPYTYMWENKVTTEDLTGLSHGLYCVAVSDANGCSYNNCYYVPTGTSGARMGHGSEENGDESNAATIIAQTAAYPNPFTSTTNITFSVATGGHTTVEVFNAVNGQKTATIFNEDTQAGSTHSCVLDGGNLASGLYIYKITSDNTSYIGKVTLVK